MATKSKLLTDRRLQTFRSRETSDYLQVTFTLLFVLVFVAFAIRPSFIVAYTLYRNIQEYKETDIKLTEKIIALKEIRATYRDISSGVILLDKAIPLESNDGELLTNINYIGARNSVQVTKTVFSYTENHENLKTIYISMEASGSYQNIKKFIDELNQLLRVISVDSVDIRPVSRLGERQRVTVTIKSKVFYELPD